ncbi:hypothetical protein [Candidatus Macondimonas diazotrophica]|jgi:uncharacterized membrane protein|uniref:Uncharacterized protein n=1 Tax=Candidatus Macondimonas diazotrophica TaxID=2305248 RepID=A0A4Z0F6N0_9GAMM|nr:hypothetical protein [Candidatus Macondimonas diazotrophica]TFZ81278.1 hypothetical protein E4680_13150 [Candidatus Macondimonas diazotrophica]
MEPVSLSIAVLALCLSIIGNILILVSISAYSAAIRRERETRKAGFDFICSNPDQFKASRRGGL